MSELKPHLMTADEAISALEMCQALMLFDPMTGETHELCEENKDNQDLYNACSLAISALRRAQPANEPLTLEQLREMHGQPVWVVPNGDIAKWHLVDVANDCCSTCDMDVVDFELYGPKDKYCGWLAYRRKPEWSENE